MIMIMETVRTTIRRFASHFDRSYGLHPDSPQSFPGNHYNKTQNGRLATSWRTPKGVDMGVVCGHAKGR